jgi:hypothetical protein
MNNRWNLPALAARIRARFGTPDAIGTEVKFTDSVERALNEHETRRPRWY